MKENTRCTQWRYVYKQNQKKRRQICGQDASKDMTSWYALKGSLQDEEASALNSQCWGDAEALVIDRGFDPAENDTERWNKCAPPHDKRTTSTEEAWSEKYLQVGDCLHADWRKRRIKWRAHRSPSTSACASRTTLRRKGRGMNTVVDVFHK